jgi:hypothetical protein
VIEKDSIVATPYKGKVKKFFTHDFDGEIWVFFSADYYLHLQDEVGGRLINKIDSTTGMNVILNNCMFPYDHSCICCIEMLLWKVYEN